MGKTMTSTDREDRPRAGCWMVRLVKGGPMVPARITHEATQCEPGDPTNLMDRSPQLVGYLAGDQCHPGEVWGRHWYGKEIDQPEYEYQVAMMAWARNHAPGSALAQPAKRIDHLTVTLPF